MSDLTRTDELFFNRLGLERATVERMTDDALKDADDGELFLEAGENEMLVFDDGKVKSASFDSGNGFGLRSVAGETAGYAHSTDLSHDAIARAARTVTAVTRGHAGQAGEAPRRTNALLYADLNPIDLMPFADKVKLMAEIDAYARARDPRVKQVTVSLAAEWRAIQIIRAGGDRRADIRPLVRLGVNIVTGEGDRRESGNYGMGGRFAYSRIVDPASWKAAADEALRQALVNLTSVPAPAGEMPVVLGPGWSGVLLHEAVGHGLEGDFNRKKTSAFAGLMGQRVAAPGVTVVDDGTIPDRRGSITFDDEGTPAGRTVLIEDGKLVGYMQDRQNARLMGVRPTGNGRRQSYAHIPMPRMTNTIMLGGDKAPEEIIRSVKRGVYAKSLGGGQVDITSGKFVFNVSEAYMIENGRLGAALKDVTLIGNGPDALTRVSMIGNDMALDPGIGTCGKNGQGVPVGVGQPTMLIDNLTVGGTA